MSPLCRVLEAPLEQELTIWVVVHSLSITQGTSGLLNPRVLKDHIKNYKVRWKDAVQVRRLIYLPHIAG